MTSAAEMRRQPTEYVGVVRLVNCYIAAHIQGKQVRFVSKHPEVDVKVAQATARAFAESKKIHFFDRVQEPKQPILTVVKQGKDWFPAELYPDKIMLLQKFGLIRLGGNLDDAKNMAGAIALIKTVDFVPSIGIFMCS